MFVAAHPTWVAAVVLVDGSTLFFDGPKDMFKFLLDPEKYRRESPEIATVWVTDYYTTRPVQADRVLFVVGSDVNGPMGPELVPIEGADAADEFARDHGSTAVLRFDEIGRDAIPR